MEKLRVLIVDDSVICRRILSDAVENTELAKVKYTASNGENAIEWLKQQGIDVVLLDTVMPGMSGIDTLKNIKVQFPDIEVIMVNSGAPDSSNLMIEAIKQGATDFIVKPSEADPNKNIEKLTGQLKTFFAQIKVRKHSSHQESKAPTKEEAVVKYEQNTNIKHNANAKKVLSGGVELIIIASSTGGPDALEVVCSQFSTNLSKPILVVQHMPPDFTKILAESLDRKCPMMVSEAQDGGLIIDGQIIIAPGGLHMVVDVSRQLHKVVRLEDIPFVNGVKPSADVLFNSIAKVYEGKNILVVILTGMGSDGTKGVEQLKRKCNCYCITQSEETCVVYGMPRCVYDMGLSDEVVDLKGISKRIEQIASKWELIE